MNRNPIWWSLCVIGVLAVLLVGCRDESSQTAQLTNTPTTGAAIYSPLSPLPTPSAVPTATALPTPTFTPTFTPTSTPTVPPISLENLPTPPDWLPQPPLMAVPADFSTLGYRHISAGKLWLDVGFADLAMRDENGDQRWTWHLETASQGNPFAAIIADADQVFLLTVESLRDSAGVRYEPATLIALNTQDGQELWRSPLAAPDADSYYAEMDLAATNQSVLLGSNQGLASFDRKSGELLWQRKDCHVPWAASHETEGVEITVVATCAPDNLMQIDPSTGATLATIPSLYPSTKLVVEKGVVASIRSERSSGRSQTYTQKFAFTRLAEGDTVWSEEVAGYLYGVVAAEGDLIYRVDNRLIRRHLADGGLVWETDLPDWQGTQNLLLNRGVLLVGSGLGYLHALDPATGYIFWTQDLWDTFAAYSAYVEPVHAAPGLAVWVDFKLFSLISQENGQPQPLPTKTPLPVTPTPTAMLDGLWTPIPPPQPDATETPPPLMNMKDADPTRLQAYVHFIGELLHRSHEDPDRFREAFSKTWPTISNMDLLAPNIWIRAVDLDGDGKLEWLVSAPLVQEFCYDTGCEPGILCTAGSCQFIVLLFEQRGTDLVPVHRFVSIDDTGRSPALSMLYSPQLLSVEDINLDGHREIVLAETANSRASRTVAYVGQWDGKSWHDLAQPGGIVGINVRVWLEDQDGDGRQEIMLHGGEVWVIWMAIQRAHTWVYGWEDGAYRLRADSPDPSDHAYFLMVDARSALASGDADRALILATRALTATVNAGEYWERSPVLEARLRSYAAIIAMLVHAQRGEVGAMRVLLDLIDQRYQEPGNGYADAAHVLWQVYQDTQSPAVACQAMARIFRNNPQNGLFQDLLSAAEAPSFNEICPLPPPVRQESASTPTPTAFTPTIFAPDPIVHACTDPAVPVTDARGVANAIADYFFCADGETVSLMEFLISRRYVPPTCTESPLHWSRRVDLNQDGQDELLIAFANRTPCQLDQWPSPTWAAYEQTGQGYRLIFDATQSTALNGMFIPPEIVQVRDLNADGQVELAIYTFWSGAMNDFKTLSLHHWDGKIWTVLATIQSAYTQGSGATQLSNENQDGLWEYRVDGGQSSSGGVFSRPHLLVYGWWKGQFALLQDTPSPSSHPYFIILDANNALAQNRLDDALALAMQVVRDPGQSVGSEWGGYDVATLENMMTYAASLAMVVHASRGEVGAMQMLLQQTEAHYDHPDNPFMDGMRSLWQVFQATDDAQIACQAMALTLRRRSAFSLWASSYPRPSEGIPVVHLCPLS